MEYHQLYAMRIQQLCDKRGITVNKLADLSGVKQSSISNIMRGVSKSPGVKNLHKIANFFSMTLSEFLDFPELNDYSFEEPNRDKEQHV